LKFSVENANNNLQELIQASLFNSETELRVARMNTSKGSTQAWEKEEGRRKENKKEEKKNV
jgi:hypothetical protein